MKDIQEIVDYAKVRGVKVVPEIGGPGHLFSGWEMVEKKYPELGKTLTRILENGRDEFYKGEKEPCLGALVTSVSKFFT